jgi:hypothetical protein
MKNTFLKQLYKFEEQTQISRAEMLEMILDWYEPMKIFTRKLDGTRMTREMYSVAGPSGNVKYDYEAKGYMIVFDAGKLGFRTIVLKNVYKIQKGGRTYLIK